MSPQARFAALSATLALTAGPSAFGSPAHADGNLALNNGPTAASGACPTGTTTGDYWHFVLTPNGGGLSFGTITLNLDGTPTSVAWIANGVQTDNVYVAVPAGRSLSSLVKAGSTTTFTGTAADNTKFNLSHVCDRTDVDPTTTTAAPTTTAPPTTTEAPTTTTEVGSGGPEPTTTAPSTTAAPSPTEVGSGGPEPEVAGEHVTATTAPAVAGTHLPATGSRSATLALIAGAILAAGASLVSASRRPKHS